MGSPSDADKAKAEELKVEGAPPAERSPARARSAGQRTLPLLRSLPGSDAIVEMRRQTLPSLRATLTCSPPLANAFFKKRFVTDLL